MKRRHTLLELTPLIAQRHLSTRIILRDCRYDNSWYLTKRQRLHENNFTIHTEFKNWYFTYRHASAVWGSNSGGGYFSNPSRTPQRSTQSPLQWVLGHYPRDKAAGGADHPQKINTSTASPVHLLCACLACKGTGFTLCTLA
jgi:hypothetical protein